MAKEGKDEKLRKRPLMEGPFFSASLAGRFFPGFEGAFPGELLQKFLFPRRKAFGDGDFGLYEEMPPLSISSGKPFMLEPKDLPSLGSRRNCHNHIPLQGGHGKLGSQSGLPGGKLHQHVKIPTFGLEERIRKKMDPQVKVSGLSPSGMGSPLSRKTYLGTLRYPRRDTDVEISPGSIPLLQSEFSRGPFGSLPKGNLQGKLLARGFSRFPGISVERGLPGTPKAPHASEEHVEKVAEPPGKGTGAPKVEAPPAGRVTPFRRRIHGLPFLPAGTELIIFFPLFRILQHFVGFVYFEVALLRLGALVEIRMELPGKLAVDFTDLLGRSGAFHSENGIIVLVADFHGISPLFAFSRIDE
jgi:hypothetical protein